MGAAGYTGKVKIGMDVAASEFWLKEEQKYDLDFKTENNDGSQKKSGEELMAVYEEFCTNYPVVSIEDPFDQDDFTTYTAMTTKLGTNCQIVGDDLLVTNPKRVQKAIDDKACNALLLKVNQIGSISESIEAVGMAKKAGWGETEDSSSPTWPLASALVRSRPEPRAARSVSPSTTSCCASRRSSAPTPSTLARISVFPTCPSRAGTPSASMHG